MSPTRRPRAASEGIPPPPAAWALVTSVVNVILGSTLTSDSAAVAPLEASLLHALTALMVEARGGVTAQRATLLSRAQDIIRRRVTQSDFTVEQLAASLNVSSRYLTQIFREAGTSPGRAIRAARLSQAQLVLHGGASSDPAVVARAAGFSSVRAMKEAFRRAGQPLPLPAAVRTPPVAGQITTTSPRRTNREAADRCDLDGVCRLSSRVDRRPPSAARGRASHDEASVPDRHVLRGG